MAGPSHGSDPASDDQTIAHQLLNKTRDYGRKVSLASLQSSLRGLDGSTAQEATADPVVPGHVRGRSRRRLHTSNTWTSSSGDVISEGTAVDDRSMFVVEYNRLAKKHCVRTITSNDDDPRDDGTSNDPGKPGGWFSRRILRKTSSSYSIKIKPDKDLKHRRSFSDSLRIKLRKDGLKDKDLQELVRICGSCLLYLPSEYATGSLAVPTCFRATAQYLVQHAPTARGIFRVPGNHRVVNQLYNHYCTLDADGAQIAGTVRCPALPEHIHCDVHDVASSFKWMLSGLPGGILGSLTLFDALISIQTQLQAYPEITRTKQSKVKARLIALAIATLKSQHRRDLICAVFGLLSMIGRTAETTKREDERGRPLPTADLMGYGPLGIVFGPLLVGKHLDNYTMRLVNPHGGLILLPISPPKSKKEKQRKPKTLEDPHFNTFVDKMKIANMVTEMLITNWRDVVRHMRNLGGSKALLTSRSLNIMGPVAHILRPSASESFALRKPPDWDGIKSSIRQGERSISPTPTRPGSMKIRIPRNEDENAQYQNHGLKIRKQRSRPNRLSNHLQSGVMSTGVLESTTEESPSKDDTKSQTGAPRLGSQKPALWRSNESEDKGTARSQKLLKEKSSEISSCSTVHGYQDSQGGSQSDISNPKATDQLNQYSLVDSTSKNPLSHSSVDMVLPTIRQKLTFENPVNYKSWPSGDQSVQETAFEEREPNLLRTTLTAVTPRARLSRANVKHDGIVSGHVRRIAASEPGKDPALRVTSRRRVSKSLYVDSKGQRVDFVVNSAAKDPLSGVSEEEDLASLAMLARALADEPSGTGIASASSSSKIKPTVANETLPRTHSNSNTAPTSTSLAPRDLRILESLSHPFPAGATTRGQPSTSSIPQTSPTKLRVTLNSTISTTQPTVNISPARPVVKNSPVKYLGTPTGSVKALAARFNSADLTETGSSRSKISPIRASVTTFQPWTGLRKDSLVAPYTVNPPSPTRSLKSIKSTKSEKTPRSARERNEEHLTGLQSPKESVIPPQLHGNELSQSSLSLYTTNDGYTSSTFMHVNEVTPTKLLDLLNDTNSPNIEPNSLMMPSSAKTVEPKMITSLDGILHVPSIDCAASNQPCRSRQHSLVPSRVSANFTAADNVLTPSHITLGQDQLVSLLAPPRANFKASRNLEIAQTAENEDNHVENGFTVSDTPTTSNAPPVRYNPTLHTQIRTLQTQLAMKSEEICQLKQRLDVRSNLDIGTMSEQLRETKKELQLWKTRAETAEKQVELLTRMPSKVSLGQNTNDTSAKKLSEQVSALVPKYSENTSTMSIETKGTAHGMDGTASSEAWGSEETTDTIVRDFRYITSGSGHSLWVEQTETALDLAGPYELE